MGSYDDGRQKSNSYGNPTTEETSRPGFMQGYRDAEESRRFLTEQNARAISLPSYTNNTDQNSVARASGPAVPDEPITLAGAVRALAGIGMALGAAYGFLVLDARWIVIVGYAFGGLAAGSLAGVVVWAAIKVLKFALWLLAWALKIGAIVVVGYFALQYFAK